jgi:hypothetical protein
LFNLDFILFCQGIPENEPSNDSSFINQNNGDVSAKKKPKRQQPLINNKIDNISVSLPIEKAATPKRAKKQKINDEINHQIEIENENLINNPLSNNNKTKDAFTNDSSSAFIDLKKEINDSHFDFINLIEGDQNVGEMKTKSENNLNQNENQLFLPIVNGTTTTSGGINNNNFNCNSDIDFNFDPFDSNILFNINLSDMDWNA